MALLHRRDSIILTAIDIMSELGIQGLTSKEIAKRQKISEGTIFRHFENKNEIILAVLKQFSQFDKDITDSLKIKGLNFKEAIRYYVTSYVEYYQNYPEIASIAYSYDGLINEKELASYIRNVFEERFKFLVKLVDQGKQEGSIPYDVDTEGLVDIIDGSFRAVLYRWRLSQYDFPLKDRTLSTIEIILQEL